MTILVENHNGFLILEHDPILYEDAKEMECVGPTGPEADLLGVDAVTGPHLQKMTKLDDWVLSIYEEQARGRGEDARRLDHAEASNEVALKTGDRGLIESKGGSKPQGS